MIKYQRYFALLLLLAQFGVNPAHGALISNRQASKSVSTSVWATQLTAQGAATTNSSYQITWTGSANKSSQLFDLVNTGNAPLTMGHIDFTSVRSGVATTVPRFTFEVCSAAWDANLNCPGAITILGAADAVSNIDFNRNLSVGTRLTIRVTITRNGGGNPITTFNSKSYKSDIGLPKVINS